MFFKIFAGVIHIVQIWCRHLQEANAGHIRHMQAAAEVHSSTSMPPPPSSPRENVRPTQGLGQQALPTYPFLQGMCPKPLSELVQSQ